MLTEEGTRNKMQCFTASLAMMPRERASNSAQCCYWRRNFEPESNRRTKNEMETCILPHRKSSKRYIQISLKSRWHSLIVSRWFNRVASPTTRFQIWLHWTFFCGLIYQTPAETEEYLLARVVVDAQQTKQTPGVTERVYKNIFRRYNVCKDVVVDQNANHPLKNTKTNC